MNEADNEQIDDTSNSLTENFFKAPHRFDEIYKDFPVYVKYFFYILCKLTNRYADSDGWFWHVDRIFTFGDRHGDEHREGFETYGLSTSSCKRARKLLLEYEIIECKKGWHSNGRCSGTYYRINWDSLYHPYGL